MTRIGLFSQRLWTWLRRSVAQCDWSMATIYAGFVFVLLGRTLVAPPLAWATSVLRRDLFTVYERALERAAVKRPRPDVPLATVDPSAASIALTTFRFPSLKLGQQKLANTLWVSLPSQLKPACAGAPDPKLKLQQVLGLPPTTGPQSVFAITARPSDLFRPCMSGRDTTVPVCADALLKDPTEDGADVAKAYEQLTARYQHLRFVANQMWTVHRIGFAAEHVGRDDYPYNGYPFTAMGWTYDWSPDSASHVGVSEFILPANSDITVEHELTPGEFCATPSAP